MLGCPYYEIYKNLSSKRKQTILLEKVKHGNWDSAEENSEEHFGREQTLLFNDASENIRMCYLTLIYICLINFWYFQ